MPTVLIKNGFRFFFYSADRDEPVHIHVEFGDTKAKFWLNPIQLASSFKMKSRDLKNARIIIEENQQMIEKEWYEYFSKKN